MSFFGNNNENALYADNFSFKKIVNIAFYVALMLGTFALLAKAFLLVDGFYYVSAEYRDAAMVKVADSFAHGINPYSAKYLSTDEAPRVFLDSGFLNCLTGAALAIITGIPTTVVLYVQTLIFDIVTLLLLYLIILKLTNKNHLCAALAVFLDFFALTRETIFVCRPDTMVALMIMLIFYIVMNDGIKNQALYCAILSVLIVHAKIHYALIAVPVFIFWLLTERKKAFKYLVWCITLGFASLLLCNILFPTYLSEWIVRILQMTSGVVANNAFITMIHKYLKVILFYLPACVIVFIAFIFCIVKWRDDRTANLIYDTNRSTGDKKFSAAIFFVINAAVNGIALLFLGKHPGASYWYYFIMLIPSVIILSMVSLNYLCKFIKFPCLLQWAFVACSVFALLKFYTLSMFFGYNIITPDYKESVREIYATIEQYHSENMLLSSTISPYSMNKEIYNFNYGDNVYVPTDDMPPFLKAFFPYTDDVYSKFSEYAEDILSNIKTQKYSLITTDNLEGSPVTFDTTDDFNTLLCTYYTPVSTAIAKATSRDVAITFWVPIV